MKRKTSYIDFTFLDPEDDVIDLYEPLAGGIYNALADNFKEPEMLSKY